MSGIRLAVGEEVYVQNSLVGFCYHVSGKP